MFQCVKWFPCKLSTKNTIFWHGGLVPPPRLENKKKQKQMSAIFGMQIQWGWIFHLKHLHIDQKKDRIPKFLSRGLLLPFCCPPGDHHDWEARIGVQRDRESNKALGIAVANKDGKVWASKWIFGRIVIKNMFLCCGNTFIVIRSRIRNVCWKRWWEKWRKIFPAFVLRWGRWGWTRELVGSTIAAVTESTPNVDLLEINIVAKVQIVTLVF